jgi:hypothetical protein
MVNKNALLFIWKLFSGCAFPLLVSLVGLTIIEIIAPSVINDIYTHIFMIIGIIILGLLIGLMIFFQIPEIGGNQQHNWSKWGLGMSIVAIFGSICTRLYIALFGPTPIADIINYIVWVGLFGFGCIVTLRLLRFKVKNDPSKV